MAEYIFNLVGSEGSALHEQARGLLRAGFWGIDPGEPHRDDLAVGDLVLLYLARPVWQFVGRAELGSAAHEWTPAEARLRPGDSTGGVVLTRVERWDPPVPIDAVLSQVDQSEGARADFETRIVRITRSEYETALRVADG